MSRSQRQQNNEPVGPAISYCNIGYINSMFENINYYSDKMYNSVSEASGGLALKIRGFTEAMQGKGDPENVVVAEQHIKYINSLNSEQYAILSKFATTSYPNMQYEEKRVATQRMFNQFYKNG